MALEGLNRLEVYKSAQELAGFVYQYVLPLLPVEERYGLCSQIRRAAASVPANIAEGYGRYYYQETIRFCFLARGSLMELSSHFDLACSQGYISNESYEQLGAMMNSVLKLIHGYVKYLKQSKRGWNEPGASAISEAMIDYSTPAESAPEDLS
ncbi:MAG TPA: four helix bundle protein [Anaerolineaceae bacterium]|nr:four helix bundle protein [Anaerolineaceae bacterium]